MNLSVLFQLFQMLLILRFIQHRYKAFLLAVTYQSILSPAPYREHVEKREAERDTVLMQQMLSAKQKMFYYSQKEKMPGVEEVKQPFQSLSFLPVIHGKGNKAESGCTVVPNRSREGKKRYSGSGTNQRMLLPEYIKQEYRNHRKGGVVRPQQK